jgi:hypothetical protein
MLEPWIIEQIRRREEEERRGNQRPRLEIPARDERDEWRDPRDRERDPDRNRDTDRDKNPRDKPRKEDEPERGVTIIDYGVA